LLAGQAVPHPPCQGQAHLQLKQSTSSRTTLTSPLLLPPPSPGARSLLEKGMAEALGRRLIRYVACPRSAPLLLATLVAASLLPTGGSSGGDDSSGSLAGPPAARSSSGAAAAPGAGFESAAAWMKLVRSACASGAGAAPL
jgi:hypothetical protein